MSGSLALQSQNVDDVLRLLTMSFLAFRYLHLCLSNPWVMGILIYLVPTSGFDDDRRKAEVFSKLANGSSADDVGAKGRAKKSLVRRKNSI